MVGKNVTLKNKRGNQVFPATTAEQVVWNDRLNIKQAIAEKLGAPFSASTASSMTDKTRIYVYTGDESGYTKGNWYYWDGSAWVSGGVYNSTAVDTDKTLSVSDKPADGEVVGQKIDELKGDLDNLNQGGLNLKEDFIGTQVDEWLDEHPETITTVQEGSLTEITFSDVLRKRKANYYESVSKMKDDLLLIDGMVCITLGYYNKNDGGGAVYTIQRKTDDDKYSFFENLKNGLVAKLNINGTINIKQLGAVGDSNYLGNNNKYYKDSACTTLSFDNATIIKKAISMLNENRKIYIPVGNYGVSESLIVNENNPFMLTGERGKYAYASSKIIAWENVDDVLLEIDNNSNFYLIDDITLYSDQYKLIYTSEPNKNDNHHRYNIENINSKIVDGLLIKNVKERGYINNVRIQGFSGNGLNTNSQFVKYDNLQVLHCGNGILTKNYDNIFNSVKIRYCDYGIKCEKSTVFMYDAWIDEIRNYAIYGEKLNIVFSGIINHADYCAIHANVLNNCKIDARINRCGCYYAGEKCSDINLDELQNASVIYSETSNNNIFNIVCETRKVGDDSSGGSLPVLHFCGKNWNKNIIRLSDYDSSISSLYKISDDGLWENNDCICGGIKYVIDNTIICKNNIITGFIDSNRKNIKLFIPFSDKLTNGKVSIINGSIVLRNSNGYIGGTTYTESVIDLANNNYTINFTKYENAYLMSIQSDSEFQNSVGNGVVTGIVSSDIKLKLL